MRASPNASRVADAISSIAVHMVCNWGERPANAVSDSGSKSISSVLPSTPGQPRSRIRSTISAGLDPPCGRSPPWKIKSVRYCRRSARTASNAVRLPWISDTTAMRITLPRRATANPPLRASPSTCARTAPPDSTRAPAPADPATSPSSSGCCARSRRTPVSATD